MLSFIEILLDSTVGFLVVIAVILAIIYYFVECCNNFDTLKSIFKRFGKRVAKLFQVFNSLKRKNYDRVLSGSEFLEFQKAVLFGIYKPLIEQFNSRHTQQIEISELFGYQYEAVHTKCNPVDYPFEGTIDKSSLVYLDEKSEKKDKFNGKQDNKRIRRVTKNYKKLIKATIKKPEKIGYMLKSLNFDKNGSLSVSAYVGRYKDNLYQSHILEYELYLLYKKYNRCVTDAAGAAYADGKNKVLHLSNTLNDKDFLLNLLPIRKSVHKQQKNEDEILLSGTGRSSLLGVQAIVACKNYNDNYDILRIRRSENVSAKPNFIQFIPSGGFEAFEDSDDFDTQYNNYSLSKVLFRELLEECFGIDEDQDNRKISSDALYANPTIKHLIAGLEDGSSDTLIKLIGSSMSLVGLRHELSFLIVVNDKEFIDKIRSNYESKSSVSFVSYENLKDIDYWNRFSEDKNVSDLAKLNCTSASLLCLATEYLDKLTDK